jgi:hypothetical protein
MMFKNLLCKYSAGKTTASKPVPDEPSIRKQEYWPIYDQIQAFNLQKAKYLLIESSSVDRFGVLIIIQDDFPNELLWRLWLISNPHIQIWIHAKYPERIHSEWVRDHFVKRFHFHPDWGSIALTKVMICLLYEVINSFDTYSHYLLYFVLL